MLDDSFDVALDDPAVIHREETDFETLTGNGEGRAEIPAVEDGHRVLITNEGDDRVIATKQRHVLEAHDEVILGLTGKWGDAVGVRPHREGLKIIGGTLHARDDMNRL